MKKKGYCEKNPTCEQNLTLLFSQIQFSNGPVVVKKEGRMMKKTTA
jgi:hypothetical protein